MPNLLSPPFISPFLYSSFKFSSLPMLLLPTLTPPPPPPPKKIYVLACIDEISLLHSAVTVQFNPTTYVVQEGQSVAFMLELIGTALIDTEVEFTTADMSATGKYTSIIVATNITFVCLSVRVGGHRKTILI